MGCEELLCDCQTVLIEPFRLPGELQLAAGSDLLRKDLRDICDEYHDCGVFDLLRACSITA
jgi:hypothetical protein